MVVLQSFPPPRFTTNPYVIMLHRSLEAQDGVRVLTFSWKRALLGGYDVFHAHWPEALLAGGGRLKRLVRQLFYAALLLRLRATRTPLVRTVHNLQIPQGLGRRETLLLRWTERWTMARIAINDSTDMGGDGPGRTIVHGHYRDWFSPHPRSRAEAGRLVFFGLIRRYKNVDRLAAAFAETAGGPEVLTLRIAGAPSTDELAAGLRAAAAADSRVSLHLEFLDDAELVAEVTAAELVVLPYREMHNSGSVLAALSLDRPVLVPDNPTNRRLRAEVGAGWLHLYTGELTGDDLIAALGAIRAEPPQFLPDLSRRAWDRTGNEHVEVYRTAVAAAGHRA
jgi:glycosyltransferase involved in cell wall biosynthesis